MYVDDTLFAMAGNMLPLVGDPGDARGALLLGVAAASAAAGVCSTSAMWIDWCNALPQAADNIQSE